MVPRDLLMLRRQASDSSRERFDERFTRFGVPKNSATGSPSELALPKSRSPGVNRSELLNPIKPHRHLEAPKSNEATLRSELELNGTICRPRNRLRPRRTIDDSATRARFRGGFGVLQDRPQSRRTEDDSSTSVRLRGNPPVSLETPSRFRRTSRSPLDLPIGLQRSSAVNQLATGSQAPIGKLSLVSAPRGTPFQPSSLGRLRGASFEMTIGKDVPLETGCRH